MDFFKDPKYKSVRIVLILVIIVGAGWFIMSNMNLSKSNQGSVINQTPATAPKPKPNESVNTCLGNCFSVASNCYVNCGQSIPCGQGCSSTNQQCKEDCGTAGGIIINYE